MSATSVAGIVKQSIGWSIGLSVLLIVAGIVAIVMPLAAGIAIDLLVAWLLIFSGCVHLAFAWYTRSAGGFIWEFLVGLLYGVTGAYMIIHPHRGLISLTLVLAIYLFIEAILEFVLGFRLRPLPGSGWLLFDGAVTLILSILIWKTWPSSTEWAIGTLVGLSMLFSGASRLGISMAARSNLSKLA